MNIGRIFLHVCTVAVAVSGFPTTLLAQDPAQPAPEVRALNFPFEPRSQAPDDELLEVARAADVDIFVDATDLPDKASQVPTRVLGKQNWYLENLLTDIGAGRRLAWEIREDERVVLLGPEANVKELRQKLLEGPGIDVAVPKLEQAAFSARLADYLRGEQGWKGDGTAWNKTLSISDLPEDLKYEMLARTQQGVFNESLGGISMMRKMISDETWKQARLVIGSQKAVAGQDKPALFLVFTTPTSSITQLLTSLPQPKPQERR